MLPAGLEGADPAVDEHEVERPVADDLVGDPDVAAARVGDLAVRPRDPRLRGRSGVRGGSSAGSCCSMRRSSSRSDAEGSIPSSSASMRRNVWKLASASAWRPDR